MIICTCRGIQTTDFSNKKELVERIMRNDFVCGLCTRRVNSMPLSEPELWMNPRDTDNNSD